jgi:hypothetical protein
MYPNIVLQIRTYSSEKTVASIFRAEDEVTKFLLNVGSDFQNNTSLEPIKQQSSAYINSKLEKLSP